MEPEPSGSARGEVRRARAARRARPGAGRAWLPALLAAAAACAGPASGSPEAPAAATAQAERGTRAEFLERWARSYVPGRSGDIMLVPAEGHILTTTRVPFMHGSPWDYDARIPLLLYGPEHVREGTYDAPASHEDLGATLTRIVGVPPWPGATGRPLAEALRNGERSPRLVAVLVLDAFRPDYLDRLLEETSTLRRLRDEGAWFAEARVSFLPTATAVTHSSLSTSSVPAVHGIVGNALYDRAAGGRVDAFPDGDPRHLLAPTLAERLAAATDGRAHIAALGGTDYPAAALVGRGACGLGGKRPLVGFYDASDPDGRWATNEECYRLPAALEGRTARALWEDVGGEWMGHAVTNPFTFSGTALFARFEGEGTRAVLAETPFGADTVPDLLLANWKALDRVSHGLGPFSREAVAVVAEIDRQLAALVSALEEAAGPDGFVLALTTDHGMPDEPEEPAHRVTWEGVFGAIQERFDPEGPALAGRLGGADAQLTLDRSRLEALGLEVEEIAAYLEGLPYIEAAFAGSEVSRAARALAERDRSSG